MSTASKLHRERVRKLMDRWKKKRLMKEVRDLTPIELECVRQARIIAADPLYGKTDDDVFIARLRYEFLVSVREKINEVSGIL